MPLDTVSVISPYHPRNNSRHEHNEDGTYVYRARETRAKLNLTLGWELEANHVPLRTPAGVEQIDDGSVNGDGAEFVVLPAITKSPRYVLGLLKELVHAPRLNTDKSCGYHVHVSASNVSTNKMRQWAIATEHLAMQIEDKAFNAVPDSRKDNSYCRRIVPIRSGTSFQGRKYGNDRRYHWLNTVEMFRPGGIGTIEVRLLGNTHRWKYLLAWSTFCMELASRGWALSQRPFDIKPHIDALTEMLESIAAEIKPLEKRNEPIPQWVFSTLESLGIPSNAWDRPLARQSEVEADIKGYAKKYYSDNQQTEENESDDENNDECACGCGESERCADQAHSDGDCDSSYCHPCHTNGDCSGSGSCDICVNEAHDAMEDCNRNHCGTCQRRFRTVTPPVVHEVVGVPTPENITRLTNIVADDGITIEPRSGVEVPMYGRSLTEIVGPMVQTQITELTRGMTHQYLLYGTNSRPVIQVDEASRNYHVIHEALPLSMMTQDEILSSTARAIEFNSEVI